MGKKKFKLTAAELIPCHKPIGRLFFFQHELEAWVEAGKKHKSHKHSKEDQQVKNSLNLQRSL